MTRILKSLVAAAFAALAFTTTAAADDRAVVAGFYDVLSSTTAPDLEERARAVMAEDWRSVGDYSGHAKTLDAFIPQLKGFGQLIPDLTWSAEEMLQDGDRYVVRGRATGTPSGPFFGVDGAGRSFEIMSIDIHTVENGKIVRSYHVEDWAGALAQLKGE